MAERLKLWRADFITGDTCGNEEVEMTKYVEAESEGEVRRLIGDDARFLCRWDVYELEVIRSSGKETR